MAIKLKPSDLKYEYYWNPNLEKDKAFNKNHGEKVLPILQAIADDNDINHIKIIHYIEDTLQTMNPEIKSLEGKKRVLQAQARKIIGYKDHLEIKEFFSDSILRLNKTDYMALKDSNTTINITEPLEYPKFSMKYGSKTIGENTWEEDLLIIQEIIRECELE
jgi:hypothetical protein